jgi:hypothetical protein
MSVLSLETVSHQMPFPHGPFLYRAGHQYYGIIRHPLQLRSLSLALIGTIFYSPHLTFRECRKGLPQLLFVPSEHATPDSPEEPVCFSFSLLVQIGADFTHKIKARPPLYLFTRLRLGSLTLRPVHAHCTLTGYVVRSLYYTPLPVYSRPHASRLVDFTGVGTLQPTGFKERYSGHSFRNHDLS